MYRFVHVLEGKKKQQKTQGIVHSEGSAADRCGFIILSGLHQMWPYGARQNAGESSRGLFFCVSGIHLSAVNAVRDIQGCHFVSQRLWSLLQLPHSTYCPYWRPASGRRRSCWPGWRRGKRCGLYWDNSIISSKTQVQAAFVSLKTKAAKRDRIKRKPQVSGGQGALLCPQRGS